MAPAKMWDAMAAGSHAVRAAVWPGNERSSGRQDAGTVPPEQSLLSEHLSKDSRRRRAGGREGGADRWVSL